jgi:putative Ca2+/H+ antiporter (TMEM165/GDT1 family)
LSLLFAGAGMLAWRRPVDLLDKWTMGPFWTAFLGIFILQLGDKGQFMLAATAARTDAWAFAATGGWIGGMIACIPAIILQEKLAQLVPVTVIRRTGGGIFLFLGLILAMGAWGLF